MRTETVRLYSYWASALINGDESGLEDYDYKDYGFNELYDWLRFYFEVDEDVTISIVDCEEEASFGTPEYPFGEYGKAHKGDVLTYTLLIHDDNK